MKWAARLRRAFGIDIKICEACEGAVKVLACMEDPIAINKILTHIQLRESSQVMLSIGKAPPVGLLPNEFK